MKTLYRSIRKRKVIYLTLFVSLVVAFTSTILIMGFNISEYSVDNFQVNKNRIFRLLTNDPWNKGGKFPYITKNAPGYIKANFPEVADFCQWNGNSYQKIEVNGNTFFKGMNTYETNPSFFKLFSYTLKEGNPREALKTKSDIVLTEATARKFFGDTPALGKIITIYDRNGIKKYTVSGVIKDPKKRSHFKFDMLTSIEGKDFRGCQVYLLLKKNVDPHDLEKKLQRHRAKIPFFASDETSVNYYLQNLTSIYLTKEVRTKILIYFIITLLILFVAFFNYINLFITQIKEREKELNIKRAIGGSFHNLTKSLVFESAILVFTSIAVSFACVKIFLPLFNKINAVKMVFSDFINLKVIGYIFILTLSLLLVSYLVIYLHLKNKGVGRPVIAGNTNKFALINTFQFAVSIILIVCTIGILKQIIYIHTADIGLDRNVVEMRLPPFNGDKSTVFKELLLKSPTIEKVSVCSASPVREGAMVLYTYEDNGVKKEYSPLYFQGDPDYISTLGMKIIEGRDYSEAEQQNKNKCIINQTMVKFFRMTSPIGKILPGTTMEIIGVVKDFHWDTFENKIPPAIVAASNTGSNVLVKINPALQDQGMAYIRQSWKKLLSSYPFEFSTVGDWFNMEHKKYDVLVRFISFFCLLAIFLSVIGLFARSISIVNHKTKEIGVRKINGAHGIEVVAMLNSNFVKWVAIAIIIASPIAWYIMHKWMENFVYKTALSWWIFALAGGIAIVVALLTVSFQSWKAATRNPVEALRYE